MRVRLSIIFLLISVSYYVNAQPANPPTPTEVQAPCGEDTLEIADPPTNVLYYWQGLSCDTLTTNIANSTSPFIITDQTTSKRYYARALDTSTNTWSVGCSFIDNTLPVPCSPANPVDSNGTCDITLTRAVPPSGVTYYWQGTSCGVNTTNSNLTIIYTGNNTYYLRAKNNYSGIWSGSCGSVVANNTNIPITSPTPVEAQASCGTDTLKMVAPPSGIIYYWQGTTCGTITSNSTSSPYIITNQVTSQTIYVRAKDTSSNCWSEFCSSIASIIPTPCTPPNPTDSNGTCDITLTRTVPPTGVTYYWQLTCGTDISQGSGTTFNVPANGTYYIRAKNNYTSVWSGNCGSITTNNIDIPSNPPAPTEILAACGTDTLKMISPPNNIVYYWQGLSCVTDTTKPTTSPFIITDQTTSKTYYIRALDTVSNCWSDACGSIANTIPTPCIPLNPTTQNNGCAGSILTRAATPPTGVTYYWQLTCGTDISQGSGTTFNVPANGTYYIRAKNNYTSVWSGNCGSVVANNSNVPDVPVTPTESLLNCGEDTLEIADPLTGTTYFWQGLSCDTLKVDTANSTSPFIVTDQVTSRTYYVRARKNSTGCFSANCSSIANTIPAPCNPSAPIDSNGTCDITLTRATPPSGVTYYWQGTSCGTSMGLGSATTLVVETRSEIYYLRARNNFTLAWSSGCDSVITNNTNIPFDPPNPTQSVAQCGADTLKTVSSPIGVTYFWQGTNCGTLSADSSSDFIVTDQATSKTYYIRAFKSSTGCWSNTCGSVASTLRTPCTPPTPIKLTNVCDITLMRANPSIGIIYYWQGTSCGILTNNSALTYEVTGSETYYLRARNTYTGLWSTNCSSIIIQ